MQKEIKKRAQFYGVAAVLIAVILVSLCYQLGYIPQVPLPQPSSSSSLMSTFSSYEDLRGFLKTKSKASWTYPYYGSSDGRFFPAGPWLTDTNAAPLSGFGESGDLQHSTTNVQVAGVDEADIVKTDDKGYLYLVTGNNVSILKAYPPEEARLLSTITFDDMTPVGIFVKEDRLAVLGSKYNMVQEPYLVSRYGYYTEMTTYTKVYDISDRTHPDLLRTVTSSGGYISSRMIGEYVYFVASQTAYYTLEIFPNVTIDKVNLPRIELDGNARNVDASEVCYSNSSDDSFLFTTIVALNVKNTAENPTYQTLMMGGTSAIYVSLHDIYITFQGYGQTSIYRLRIENSTISPEAQGEVPGNVLNQFSMDEHNNYFRIATTTWTNWTSQHNVYVLDMNMSIVGRLENLAPSENLHSARFVGNKCYLVTFKKTDPLFVINLTDPTSPAVLGELEIPGYSDYLHPYDEDHLIGVGKETVEAEQGYFAWYQGIKVALFDVSNVSNPLQIANYTIGDRGSDSPVLREHKAFLFDKSKNLLVIPVLVAEVDQSQYPGGVPSYAYGQAVWQGAYVFNVTLNEGFVFRGGITHIENGISISDSNHYVERSLYIENVLYTVSNAKVKLNSLDDLAFLKEIKVN